MLIQILPDDEYLVLSKDAPVVGLTYTLEPAESGTGAQNRLFHALVGEYWKSGAHSYNATSFEEFRNKIKRALGAGFEAYVYVLDGKIVDAEKYSDIPEEIRSNPRKRDIIRGRLKSWADYSKGQRRETIDKVIAEMHQAGVNTKKFYEILEGLERAFA